MTRILGCIAIAVTLCVSTSAQLSSGSIGGSVKDSSGVAQTGAVVEMLAIGTGQHVTAYTDADGKFNIAGLGPGNYNLRVSAPSFLPTVREDIILAAGVTKIVNITLNTIFDAARIVPPRKRSDNGR